MGSIGSIVLSVLLIGSIVAPFWFIMRSVRKREKRLEKTLRGLQEKYSLNFDELHETWNDKLIGIDPRSRWFVFLNLSEKTPAEVLVDLSHIDVVRIQRKTSNENGKSQIHQVEIQFRTAYEVEKWQSVTIFDTAYDDPMDAGFNSELAKKWVAKIEPLLNLPKKRKAS